HHRGGRRRRLSALLPRIRLYQRPGNRVRRGAAGLMPVNQPVEARAVNVDRDGAVAIVTVNRPGSLNAIDQKMASELVRAGDLIAVDPSISVVVIRGAGR